MNIDYTSLSEIPCPVCGVTAYSIVTKRFDGGRIVRCTACQHIYLNPVLNDSMLDVIYADYHLSNDDAITMSRIDGWYANPDGPYQHALMLVERCGGFAAKRVLEIGSGPGRFLYTCRERGAQVTGLDIGAHSIRLAKKYFDLDLLPLSLEAFLAQKIFADTKFDLVFAFELIEHVRYPSELMRMIYDVLTPGGMVIFSTPNFGLYAVMRNSAPAVRNWHEHLHFFDAATLAQLMRRQRFDIVSLATVSPLLPEERQRQQLVASREAMALWQRVKNIGLIRRAKEQVFKLLSRRHDSAELTAQVGVALFCVGRRAA